jgi:hypothetical protein
MLFNISKSVARYCVNSDVFSRNCNYEYICINLAKISFVIHVNIDITCQICKHFCRERRK